jgi:hypothetical protein
VLALSIAVLVLVIVIVLEETRSITSSSTAPMNWD